MKISEFIFKYKKASDDGKVELIEKNIKHAYVPYETKVAHCKAIADKTMLEDGRIKMNTPARYMLLICVFIQDHMGLDFVDLDNVAVFNQLEELGVDDMICATLPSEFKKYRAILDMIADDLLDEKRNYVDYIDRVMTELIAGFNELAKMLPKEEVKNGQ